MEEIIEEPGSRRAETTADTLQKIRQHDYVQQMLDWEYADMMGQIECAYLRTVEPEL